MPYNPSNFSQAQRGQLDYLFESLGIRELFERMNAIDGEGGPMEEVDPNPTGDPAVQPNMEGIGSYSGGPNSENDGSMATHDPNMIEKIQREADERESEELEVEYEEAENEELGNSNRSD